MSGTKGLAASNAGAPVAARSFASLGTTRDGADLRLEYGCVGTPRDAATAVVVFLQPAQPSREAGRFIAAHS